MIWRFRPLIRGFFFYLFIKDRYKLKPEEIVSVPSFGDSFFILQPGMLIVVRVKEVSVPSFGDSFFINAAALMFNGNGGKFPSPHSGILFL